MRAFALCSAAVVATAAVSISGRVMPMPVPTNMQPQQLKLMKEYQVAALAGNFDLLGAKVHLDGGAHSYTVGKLGAFEFRDVPAGEHLLEIFHPHVVYSTFQITVGADSSITVAEYRYPGAPRWPSVFPIEAKPVAAATYFDPQPNPMDALLGMLKSPMVLMLLAMGGLMLCMKFAVDPEQLKEMQEEQKRTLGAAGGDPMAAMAALLKGEDPTKASKEPERQIGNGEDGNPVLRRR